MQIKMGSSGVLSWEEHETYVLYQTALFSWAEGQPDLLLNNNNNNNNNTLNWLITSVLAWKQRVKCEKVSPYVLFFQGIRTGSFQNTTEKCMPFYINLYQFFWFI